jgi:hypothetical protein
MPNTNRTNTVTQQDWKAALTWINLESFPFQGWHGSSENDPAISVDSQGYHGNCIGDVSSDEDLVSKHRLVELRSELGCDSLIVAELVAVIVLHSQNCIYMTHRDSLASSRLDCRPSHVVVGQWTQSKDAFTWFDSRLASAREDIVHQWTDETGIKGILRHSNRPRRNCGKGARNRGETSETRNEPTSAGCAQWPLVQEIFIFRRFMVKRFDFTRDLDPRPGMGNLFGTCNAGGVLCRLGHRRIRYGVLRMYSVL